MVKSFSSKLIFWMSNCTLKTNFLLDISKFKVIFYLYLIHAGMLYFMATFKTDFPSSFPRGCKFSVALIPTYFYNRVNNSVVLEPPFFELSELGMPLLSSGLTWWEETHVKLKRIIHKLHSYKECKIFSAKVLKQKKFVIMLGK